MYNAWPFFRVTIDLVEMVFAKGDPGIAASYHKLLVSEELWLLSERLRVNCEETKNLLLQVCTGVKSEEQSRLAARKDFKIRILSPHVMSNSPLDLRGTCLFTRCFLN